MFSSLGTGAAGSVNVPFSRTCVSSPSTLTVNVRYTVTPKVTVTSPQVSVTSVSPAESAETVSVPPSTAADATVSSADETETVLP